MKATIVHFLFAICLISFSHSQAQEITAIDSVISKTHTDSIIQAQYLKKIQDIESLRIKDAIKKSELLAEINSLKTTDNLKKEALQGQLEAISNQEANRLASKIAAITKLRSSNTGFPVTGFFKDTLFTIYSNLGSFSAQERAKAVSNRIQKLGKARGFNSDSLIALSQYNNLNLKYQDLILMSLSEDDALWANQSLDSLAKQHLTDIAIAVTAYQEETNIVTLLQEFGLALLVILITYFILKYIVKLFRWTALKIYAQENKRIKGIKIRDYTLFDASRQVGVLINLNSVLKWLVMLSTVYIALPILFGIFPWTKNMAQTLFGYILDPLKDIGIGLWNFLPNLITIVVIVIVFRYVLKGLYFLKSEIQLENLKIPGFYPDWAAPTYQIVKVLVFAFMVVVIFPYLPGSDSPVFQGVSVFLGFLFTFGSAGSLSNIIAGLVLTYMRLFKMGDRVMIGSISGDVIEKNMLVTRVRTIKNEIISIPNATVMNSHTINYSSDAPEKGLIMHSTITIGYDVPWRAMHEVLVQAALKTPLLLEEPAPFVLQTSLDDFYVSYQVNAYTREPNKQAKIYSDLHQNIQDGCNAAGIEIMSPHYRAARDGNQSTIPADQLPKDYQIPSFRFKQDK
ncbi:MAG: mechanosensitive ion channel family protein [Flavobacteriia bacterium]|nr:mechanosensitive ion channel family protein [Flavobacteriia bacterium]